MTEIILIAHGTLASSMKQSAEMICQSLPFYHPIEFLPQEGLETVVDKISAVMDGIHSESVLIMTDLFAGTPYNAGCYYAMKHPERNIRVLSGMSLPIVIEASTLCAQMDAAALSGYLLEAARVAVRLFDPLETEEEEELD